MKKTKRLLAVLLTLAMMLAMNMTAFAATISAPNDTKYSGHTYEVYQIFTGDYANGTLSNLKWGKNGKMPASSTGEEVTVQVGSGVPESVTNDLSTVNSITDNKTKLGIITKYADLTATNKYGEVTSSNSLTNVPNGYYLIKDVDKKYDNKNDSYTLYVVKVIGADLTISPKANVPTFEKKVKDINDSGTQSEPAGVQSSWQDGADWDIGDTIPFQLKGTVADNYADYNSYTFVFHDHESDGLNFDPESVVVKVDDATISTGYEVKTEDLSDGCTFEIRFDDLKDIEQVRAGSVITAEYNAILKETAVIGSEGNPNMAKLEFSNNPNDEQGGTGETPWDTVIVFTYKVVVNKVDSKGESLAGAAFMLEKNINGMWTPVGPTYTAGTETSFAFTGLDDGDYRLTETATPATYNSIDPIEFTVTAEHDITSDNPALTMLSGNVTTGTITFTPNPTDGSLTTNVENKKGPELPETGGIGTTIFYVVGGILVIGAGILLITKKRMNTKENSK